MENILKWFTPRESDELMAFFTSPRGNAGQTYGLQFEAGAANARSREQMSFRIIRHGSTTVAVYRIVCEVLD
jgi:hypothetical protein